MPRFEVEIKCSVVTQYTTTATIEAASPEGARMIAVHMARRGELPDGSEFRDEQGGELGRQEPEYMSYKTTSVKHVREEDDDEA